MLRQTRSLLSVVALCSAATQLSCGGDSAGPGPVAATLEANSPTAFSGSPGTSVAEPPSVIVRDAEGAAIPGVTVTFAMTAGGGSIAGTSQVTNSGGIATLGAWVLGSLPGTNTVTASVQGLAPVVFTATSVDPCLVDIPHTLGSTTQATLANGDCELAEGHYVDFYAITLSSGTYVFNQSGDIDTNLFLFTPTGFPVGLNDDIASNNQNSRIKAILPSGDYILVATSFEPSSGPYTLSSASGTEVTNCEEVFVRKGISTTQSLQSTDCPTNGFSDEYLIFLDAGQSVTVSMASTAVNSFLTLLAGNRTTITTNDDREAGTNDARLTYTTSGAGFFYIRAGSAVSGATGEYTLVIQ